MRKVTKMFKICFRSSQVDCDGIEPELTVDAVAHMAPRKPPVFPNKSPVGRTEFRPSSPFETRLRRLGQKIEHAVSKEDTWSDSSRLKSGVKHRSDGESFGSERELTSELTGRISRRPGFVSIDSSEPEICTRLEEEEELLVSSSSWMQNTGSCASNVSIRELTRTQYLFYEDEEDVVMEFFPSLRVIQQAS
eukprot:g1954.t1